MNIGQEMAAMDATESEREYRAALAREDVRRQKATTITPAALAHKCQQAANLVAEIMLETRSYELYVGGGTNGPAFQVDRRGFDRLFDGMPATIRPVMSDPTQVKKSVQVCDEVSFYCLYEENPAERVARLLLTLPKEEQDWVIYEAAAHRGV